jgi:hypothetical protein
MLKAYITGFREFDRENLENVKLSVKWNVSVDEFKEFIEEPPFEKAFDVLRIPDL